MDFEDVVKDRRSIRRYLSNPIPDYLVQEILNFARYAPSSMNGQPWVFIVIRNEETKRRIVEIKNRYCPAEKQAYQADFLLNAPVLIVVCVDKHKSYDRGVENAVLATGTILLAAHSYGVGSVYMSAYREDDQSLAAAFKETLNIPSHIEPVTLIPLGYPDEITPPRRLISLKEIVFYEKFGPEYQNVFSFY